MASTTPAKPVTVEDASPSPEQSPASLKSTPKLPEVADAAASPSAAKDVDTPEQKDTKEEDEEWDPSAESDIKATRTAAVEKGKEGDTQAAGGTGAWQAIWAPANNAYYFWNSKTGATTWVNPLVPPPSSTAAGPSQPPLPPSSELPPPLPSAPLPSSSWGEAYGAPSTSSGGYPTFQPPLPTESAPSTFTAPLPPIDPALAHLLPRGASGGSEYQTAQFNSRTGRFTPKDYQYTPDHLAEANRAKRQEGVFFNVAEWEKKREMEYQERMEVERGEKKRKADEESEGGAGPAKKLTKADMERFKQKKLEKKARNNAWLKN